MVHPGDPWPIVAVILARLVDVHADAVAVRPQPFRLVREDERETFSFLLGAPASQTAGAVRVRAVARDAAGRRYEAGLVTVDYPHIRPRSYLQASVVARCPYCLCEECLPP